MFLNEFKKNENFCLSKFSDLFKKTDIKNLKIEKK